MIKITKKKKTRTIDGKRYKYCCTRIRKREAEATADNLRAQGYNVRIITGAYQTGQQFYKIYKRKK